MAGVLNRFSFPTAAEKQLKHTKRCKKHCFLVVGLEKVVFREGNYQGDRKLRADPAQHFARVIQRRNQKQTGLNLGNDDSISSKVIRTQT